MGRLRIFRATELPPGEEVHSLEEVVADIYGSAVYFQDTCKQGVERVYLAGFGERTPDLEQALSRELDLRPQALLVPGTRARDAKFLGIYGMVAEQAKE